MGSLAFWRAHLKTATDKRNRYRDEEWKINVERYLARTLKSTPSGHTVVVPKDFSNTEQKKAQLFFRVPEIHLTPRRPEFQQAVPVFQAKVNHTLGRHGVNAKALMHEVLTDVELTGLMIAKIGYEPTQDGEKPVVVGQQPMPNVGDVLGLNPVAMQPIIESVPNIIHERYFLERVSPGSVVIPGDFKGSDYDRAAYLGFEFELDAQMLARRFGIDPALVKSGTDVDQQQSLDPDAQKDGTTGEARPKVKGTELWYRAALFDKAVKHPELMRCLVLIDGVDEPLKHADSPYQRQLPDGRLLGMKGYPVHIGALYYTPDSAYPTSDVSMSRAQVDELSKGRTQMVQQRERNNSMRWADKNRADVELVNRIVKGEVQEVIPTDGNGDEIIGEIARAQFPRENFEFNRVTQGDIDDVWAFSPAQRGNRGEGSDTATEASIIQSNADVRMAWSQGRVLDWFLGAVEKLGALIQLFADDEDYLEVAGPDGITRLEAWDRSTVEGAEFVYSAKANSAIRQDSAIDMKRLWDRYSLLANDPNVNRVELLRWALSMSDMDADKLVIAELPEKKPELKSNLSVKGEDLNPAAPQFPVIKAALEQQGIQLPAEAIQLGLQLHQKAQTLGAPVGDAPVPGPEPAPLQTEHGGMQAPQETLSKHQTDLSGMIANGGAAA
ncbi:MAG: hypothetical protein GEV06_19835 [Luteitalea sp.]|nr:hypothetical protein [Luteitalea sp.]